MLSIDEAIAREREIAERNLILLDYMEFTKGYNKALDDFVKFASDMPTVEEDDGTIRPMWLEEMAEQIKRKIQWTKKQQ